MAEGGLIERCLNCGNLHDTGDCDYPSFIHSCSACNIISIDGEQHDPPCTPNNGKSSFRRNIYSVQPIELFRIRLAEKDDWFYVLDAESGKMIMVHDGLIMQSPGSEATFRFVMKSDDCPTVICSATALKRFTALLAKPVQSAWRFRARIIPTNDNGLLCFPMRKAMAMVAGKYVIPSEFKYNAAIVIGIGSCNKTTKLQFKVRASTDGKITDHPFNGYYGSLSFDENGEVSIGHNISREGASAREFSNQLGKRYVPNKKANDFQKEKELFEKQMESDRLQIAKLQQALKQAEASDTKKADDADEVVETGTTLVPTKVKSTDAENVVETVGKSESTLIESNVKDSTQLESNIDELADVDIETGAALVPTKVNKIAKLKQALKQAEASDTKKADDADEVVETGTTLVPTAVKSTDAENVVETVGKSESTLIESNVKDSTQLESNIDELADVDIETGAALVTTKVESTNVENVVETIGKSESTLIESNVKDSTQLEPNIDELANADIETSDALASNMATSVGTRSLWYRYAIESKKNSSH